jgi:1-phosphofructokinase family hexose kinase
MILTVTGNTTVDLTLFLPEFVQQRTIRATDALYSPGGKPTDASYVLAELGIPSKAIGFYAGATGIKLERMLQAKGVDVDFTEVEGETRICVNVVVPSEGWQTTITTVTMEVLPEHLTALRAQYLDLLPETTCVVLGGTLPRGMDETFYTDFIALARERDIPVIFDAAEPNLSAGLKSQPTYIKPNNHELEGLVGYPIETTADAYRAGRSVFERFGVCPIISLGSEGGLAVLPDTAYRIPPLDIEVVSATGAGDAILAGLAASIFRGQPVEEGLRLGFAAASAVCMMPGTADCRREDVERLLPHVQLIPYNAN